MDQAAVVRRWLTALGRTDLDILEVGCGSGWFCAELAAFGSVTGTDLADDVLERARRRTPAVTFVAGDFMKLPFGKHDVVVSLEVLSHVSDQPAFVEKLASHLRPGGHLMLATQNRPVLQRYNRLPPPGPGQLRRWVDAGELRALLAPRFEVKALFSITPRSNIKPWSYLHSRTMKRLTRPVMGDGLTRFFERRGLGWTLMVNAVRRSDTA
jgi:2-polyprenyl-3-methyl-5-hydroxy-6-metoxy-1,4-benzoquinol methylase